MDATYTKIINTMPVPLLTMGRNADKLNAIAGVAALSALVAALLIVSNMEQVKFTLSSIASQMPAWTSQPNEIVQQLVQIRVQFASMSESLTVYTIGGLVGLSITTTVAAAKIYRNMQPFQ
ncbi:MAG TPA: hypothetical protein VJP79_00450 [Nitrososphaera sp.]|nr:hypothetical protein [Nitrososphaera sp.]